MRERSSQLGSSGAAGRRSRNFLIRREITHRLLPEALLLGINFELDEFDEMIRLRRGRDVWHSDALSINQLRKDVHRMFRAATGLPREK